MNAPKAPTIGPQTWAVRDVISGKLLAVRQPLSAVFALVQAHHSANPGARFLLACDTQAAAAPAPTVGPTRSGEPLCPRCCVDLAVERGNLCENLCDACFSDVNDNRTPTQRGFPACEECGHSADSHGSELGVCTWCGDDHHYVGTRVVYDPAGLADATTTEELADKLGARIELLKKGGCLNNGAAAPRRAPSIATTPAAAPQATAGGKTT